MMYLRINDDKTFGFVTEEIHEIELTDIEISQEDYELFLEKQENGILHKLRDSSSFQIELGLFGYLEKTGFISEPHKETEEEIRIKELEEQVKELANLMSMMLKNKN